METDDGRQSFAHQTETVRSMIRDEHQMLSNRMAWMNTLQGLLFAALSVGWNRTPVVYVLAVVGATVSAITAAGAFAATVSIYNLSDWWHGIKPPDYAGPFLTGMRRPVKNRFVRTLLPWNLLPIVFMVAWIAVAVIRYKSPG